MAILRFGFRQSIAPESNFHMMEEGIGTIYNDTSSLIAHRGTGWHQSNTPAGYYSLMIPKTLRASFGLWPSQLIEPKNAYGNSFRSSKTYNGVIKAGQWFACWTIYDYDRAGVRGVGRMRFNLYKGTSPVGIGSVLLLQNATCTSLVLDSTPALSYLYFDMPDLQMNNEYLFINPVWEITRRADSENTSVLMKTHDGAPTGHNNYAGLYTGDYLPTQNINHNNPILEQDQGASTIQVQPGVTSIGHRGIDSEPVVYSPTVIPGEIEINHDSPIQTDPEFGDSITISREVNQETWFVDEFLA